MARKIKSKKSAIPDVRPLMERIVGRSGSRSASCDPAQLEFPFVSKVRREINRKLYK